MHRHLINVAWSLTSEKTKSPLQFDFRCEISWSLDFNALSNHAGSHRDDCEGKNTRTKNKVDGKHRNNCSVALSVFKRLC